MITTLDDYKAMIECSYKIGDDSIAAKKETLTEATKNTKPSLFEAIGDSVPMKSKEAIEFHDGVLLKFNLKAK